MKKEEYFRYDQYQNTIKRYRNPRIRLAFSMIGIFIFIILLRYIKNDPICLSSDIMIFVIKLCLGISIFTTLITLFVSIPSGGKKYEYMEAMIKLKEIIKMADK